MVAFLEGIGQKLLGILEFTGSVVVLLAATAKALPRAFSRTRETVNQMYLVGVQSMPVVLIFALFSGMILALQIGVEFSKYNQISLLATTVVSAMCKEWGPMMTAIILTARAGSAMSAELSVMKVSEEIDALQVMSINPARYLVMPRIIATIVMCMVLTILSSFVGTWGGYLVYKFRFSSDAKDPSLALTLGSEAPSYRQYFSSAKDALIEEDIYSGLVKSAVFGLVIAAIASTRGLLATKGAAGVGIAVRDTVVNALMVIIVLNYIISNLFVGAPPG